MDRGWIRARTMNFKVAGQLRPGWREKRSLGAVPLLFLLHLGLMGCGGVQVYNFGGEGHGQVFHVPTKAAMNKSAIVQSWIAYSLARSTCKLEMGGPMPSANDSFECEMRPRRVLAQRWARRIDSPDSDEYLDQIVRVFEAGLMEEYVWHYLRSRDWERPEGLEMDRFTVFRRAELKWHRPHTRLIGYWGRGRPGLATTNP